MFCTEIEVFHHVLRVWVHGSVVLLVLFGLSFISDML